MKKSFVVIMTSCLLLLGILPASAQAPSLTSAFAVQNLGDADAQIVVEWYDEEGSIVYTSPGMIVAPGGLGNFLVGAGLPASWVGSVVVYSDQPVSTIVNTTDKYEGVRKYEEECILQ